MEWVVRRMGVREDRSGQYLKTIVGVGCRVCGVSCGQNNF